MSPAKNKSQPATDRSRFMALAGVAALLIAGLAYWSWRDTPQLSADSEVYASLDALFTAVTARREPLVTNCETKLLALHRDGKIPEPAWKKIAHVIDLANTGQWESAAKELYLFIERQKRHT